MNQLFTGVSKFSHQVDTITLVLTLVCAFVALGIFLCIGYFCFKYHSSRVTEHKYKFESEKLEYFWIAITLVIFMVFFFWATHLYRQEVRARDADYKIFVYGKRWMWKFQHENGFMEINHLHVPTKKEIKFIMISKDVIHSFYLPAFRIKQDVLPEMFSFLAIHPEKVGVYPLFCSEYCGTAHSAMKGKIEVLPEADYLKLIGDNHKQGRLLFQKHGCISCHSGSAGSTGPSLLGLSDDDHLRKSILYPQTEKNPNYEAVMPSYKNVLEEEEVRDLIEYIKDTKVENEKLL
jgi:cytochrome c oxidase subunit II